MNAHVSNIARRCYLNCVAWHLFVDSWQVWTIGVVVRMSILDTKVACSNLRINMFSPWARYFIRIASVDSAVKWVPGGDNLVKGVQCYELFGGIALKNHTFSFSFSTATLVSAFVLSRIDYCNSLLFGSTHDVTSHLQRIQNYAARVILCLPKSSSITIHLKSLHWLPVKVRSTYKIACLCYHCHSSTASSYATGMLHWKPLHTRNTRSSSYTMPLLNRPAHSKATLGDRSFSFASSFVWNSIPNDVRCAPSLSSFKSRLKAYLFRSVYKDWTVSLITVHMCMVWPCHGFVDGLS